MFQISICQLLASSSLRMQLIVSILMHLSQQFSGITCVSNSVYMLHFLSEE